MSWIAVAVIGGSVLGAAGSYLAGSQQAGAATNAANIQNQMFQQTYANQTPWIKGGQAAQSELNYLLGIPGYENPGGIAAPHGTAGTGRATAGQGMPASTGGGGPTAGGGFGSLLSPFTIDTFHQLSPAYQFQLQQGMQGTINADASGAGALSGTAQKDLIGYNQNLANTSFNNAFNQYQTQQGNIYARLAGIATTGQAAASNAATGASTFGGNIGQQVYNAGTATAGGTVGATNALGGIAALPWLLAGRSTAGGGNIAGG